MDEPLLETLERGPENSLPVLDPFDHYHSKVGPIEHPELDDCDFQIRNIGWTLGNECPYRCHHCYSMSARRKGRSMERWMVDRIVDELSQGGIETVNLGGNEPLFTNGIDPRTTLLPFIVKSLTEAGILVGLTTAGVTLNYLAKHHPETVARLNDIDVSFDSPYEEEHNRNRGANLYRLAIQALEIARRFGIPHTVIMCGMAWNFTPRHLKDLVALARRHDAYVRINPIKPVEASHHRSHLSADQYYRGFEVLMSLCEPVDLGEPPLATVYRHDDPRGCPCGRSSFRIHSITPDGVVPVSPCVYLHDYKTGNLLVDDLETIIHSPQFRSFRRRTGNPDRVEGCAGCEHLQSCRGGCAARSYLEHLHRHHRRTLFARDPYCPRDRAVEASSETSVRKRPRHRQRLVHQDYLCTWIGAPYREQEGDAR